MVLTAHVRRKKQGGQKGQDIYLKLWVGDFFYVIYDGSGQNMEEVTSGVIQH